MRSSLNSIKPVILRMSYRSFVVMACFYDLIFITDQKRMPCHFIERFALANPYRGIPHAQSVLASVHEPLTFQTWKYPVPLPHPEPATSLTTSKSSRPVSPWRNLQRTLHMISATVFREFVSGMAGLTTMHISYPSDGSPLAKNK
jgi:hypothetical protein